MSVETILYVVVRDLEYVYRAVERDVPHLKHACAEAQNEPEGPQ